MEAIFGNMRHLTSLVSSRYNASTMQDLMIFSATRSKLEHRLLTTKIRKAVSEMLSLEYQFEAFRLAALIYLKCVCWSFQPTCTVVRDSKLQLMELIAEGEQRGFRVDDFQWGCDLFRWVLFIGGIQSLILAEEEWFAMRIAKSIQNIADGTRMAWSDMEEDLRQVCWTDRLRTAKCRSLWERIREIQERIRMENGCSAFPIESCDTSLRVF